MLSAALGRKFRSPRGARDRGRFSTSVHALTGKRSVGRSAMAPAKRPAENEADRKLKVLFIAGFGPIGRDLEPSRKLYVETLGLSFEEGPGGYLHTGTLDGAKHFAIWPLAQASESCFGTDRGPSDLPVPQAWIEFDVEDVPAATDELTRKGYQLLVTARKEPWGQTVTRLLGPEGLLVGVTHTPWMRGNPSRSAP